ncbi:MAG TPA: hypothetical protein VFD06_15395, partial [Candidatus Polarisedimenticolia bacterium]|nr:hypothetical protein [Candidatus Polarisedimenticolia bacterium]
RDKRGGRRQDSDQTRKGEANALKQELHEPNPRLPNARRQLQAARNRRMGNHARIEGAPTDSCTP